jgi:hypothetical protein
MKGKPVMRKIFLVLIALMVLLLAAGGDFASQLLKQHTQISLNAEDMDAEEKDAPVQHIKSASIFNSIVNITNIIFHSDLIFEFDLPVISETKAHSVIDTALNFTRHYRTLFQIIISPNAP